MSITRNITRKCKTLGLEIVRMKRFTFYRNAPTEGRKRATHTQVGSRTSL